jgi:hypothetical protein
MKFEKVRYAAEPKPIILERDENTLLHNLSTESGLKVSAENVSQVLNAKFSGKAEKKKDLEEAIAKEFDCSTRTASDAIKRAIALQLVVEKREGRTKTIYSKT